MSQQLGLCIGENFAEISASASPTSRQKIFKRWFLSKTNLIDGLKNFFAQNPDLKRSTLNISTNLAHTVIRRRSGPNIALLVTSDFESWPRLRQPVKQERITLVSRRHNPLLSQDLIFGVSERIDNQGTVLRKLEIADLEFLAQKLELMETKQVAVGFLNAHKNPEHEQLASHFLKEKGFEVLCSHEVEESNNEVARWWRAVLNAYVSPAFHELEETLKPIKEEFQVQVRFWNSDGELFTEDPASYFSSAFGTMASLAKSPAAKKTDLILHFGLERFLLIHPQEHEKIWHSDFGPVAISSPRIQRLRVQPTQYVDPEFVGQLFLNRRESSFEPGPMFLGRAIRPTFLDLVFTQDLLKETSGLSEWIDANSKTKIHSAIATHFKGQFREESTLEFILDLCLGGLAQEVSQAHRKAGSILVTGPLADTFLPLLESKLTWLTFKTEKWSSYAESYCSSLVKGDESP